MKETNDTNSQTGPGKPADLGAGKGRPAAGAPLTAVAPVASNVAGLQPPRSRKRRKRKGVRAEPRSRLDREILAQIGKGLRESFEDVRCQEVPERFKVLLRQF